MLENLKQVYRIPLTSSTTVLEWQAIQQHFKKRNENTTLMSIKSLKSRTPSGLEHMSNFLARGELLHINCQLSA